MADDLQAKVARLEDELRRSRAETAAELTVLMTDSLRFYAKPGRPFKRPEPVDHSLGEYVGGDRHINTAEGHFSQLKRSTDGTHRHVSAHHLHRYLGAFDFRHNTRKMQDAERTMLAIRTRPKASG